MSNTFYFYVHIAYCALAHLSAVTCRSQFAAFVGQKAKFFADLESFF